MLSFDRVISSTKKNKKLDEINMDTVKSLSNELKSGNEEAISNYLGKTNKIITKKNTSKEKDDSSKGFLQKGALSVFDDGYDIGDITKSILGGSAATVGDITLNVAKGAGNIVEGLADIVSYGVAGTADLIGKDDYAENVRKRTQVGLVDKFTKKADDYLDQYSFAGNLTDNISQGIGTVGSIILTGGLGSAAGLGTAGTTALTTGVMGASSMGSGMSEAYRSGATDGQAFAYGTIAGLAEAGTELLFGGLGKAVNAVGLSKGLSSLDDALAKKVSSKISNQITKNFAEYGIKAGAEGFEEVASGFMQALGKKATYMSEEELGKILEDENLLEQFVTGAITSGIAQSGYVPGMKQGSLIEANKTGRDFISGYTQNEQKVIDSLVNEQVNGIAKKNALENELNKAIENKETEQGGILSVKEKNALKSKIEAQIANGEIDISSTKVSNKDISKIRAAVEENMQKGLLDTNTIESVLGTDTDLSNDGYLQKSYIETAKKKEAFTYENKITDAKEKAVYESAAKYFNNTTRSHEFVERVAKISKDKGTNYGFINNDELQTLGHDVEGKQVNGLVRTNKNGEQTVLINVDSPKALETIVGHETTHLLEGTQEYKDLQEAIFNYAKEKGDFNTRQEALNSLYEGIENANVDSELTADLVGDYLFTDTDFINSLSTQKPTVFQRIKEVIDDLVVRFTGTKEEKALREVQKKFKEAYRKNATDTNVATNETQYSLSKFEVIDGIYKNVLLKKGEPSQNKKKLEEYAKNNFPDYNIEFDIFNDTEFTIKSITETSSKEKTKTLNDEINFKHDERPEYDSKEWNDLEDIRTRIETLTNELDKSGEFGDYGVDYEESHASLDATYIKLEDNEGETRTIRVANHNDSTGWSDYHLWLSDYKSKTELINDLKKLIYDIRNGKSEIKYSLTDNKGRELTQEQQEYFKDSKARDENGNLLTMYHGTDGDFTIFEKKGGKRNIGGLVEYNVDTKMFFFTTSKDFASDFGENTKEVYLNITNPLFSPNKTYSDSEIDNIRYILQPLVDEEIKKGYIEVVNYNDGSIRYYDGTFYRPPENVWQRYASLETGIDWEHIDSEAFNEVINRMKEKGYDGTFVDELQQDENGNSISSIAVFNSNQIKNVDNTNPTDNPDIRYSLSEDSDVNTKINSTMTMEQAKRMIEMAFVDNGIYSWYDGKYKNGDEWLKSEGIDEVETYLDNTVTVLDKYLNPIYDKDSSYGDEYFTSDILQAYLDGTLTGQQKQELQRLDLSKDTGYKDNRFYAPQDIVGGQELYQIANQRVTNANRNEVYKARADFIINAHNKGYIESLGLTQSEVNSKLKSWANYPKKAMELSNSLNEGVARQNRWTGIENSSIVNTISVTNEDMAKLVKEIQGDSNEWQRQYITSTMLALDTHIDYSNVTFKFGEQKQLNERSALGEYLRETDTILIGNGYQNTVAHEIGHYIDSRWARDLGLKNNYLSDSYVKTDGLTTEQAQFVNNFKSFIADISENSYLGSKYTTSGRGTSYWQHNTEIFARFVGKFVEWTKNTATNNRYGYEEKFYQDNFTEKQFRDFVKILQEKAMLDTTNSQYSLSQQNEAPTKNPNLTYGEDIKLQVEEAIAPLKEQINELTEQLANNTTDNVKVSENPNMEQMAPIPQDIVEQQNKEAFKNIDDSNMPSEVEDTTPDNEAKMTTSKSLFETRDYADVGDRKVNAYQYDNPEVKPYFQETALAMLGDLKNSIKGVRIYNDEAYYNSNGEIGFYGVTRQTTDDIAELLDGMNGKFKYTYADIEKGLNAIINDEGAENNAISKRIEMYLDQRLRQGYTTVDGFEIPANQEYIDMMAANELTDTHNNMPITDDLAPVENVDNIVDNVSNSEFVAPVKENALNFEKTVQELGEKNNYISNKADELYTELKGLKKGVRASEELGTILDLGYEWRRIKNALLNIKYKPDSIVDINSSIESTIREMIGRDYEAKYENMMYGLEQPNQNLSIKESNVLKLKNLEQSIKKYNNDAQESLELFDELILEKKQQYSELKRKDTNKANNLLQQITNLETRRDNIQVEYERKMNNVQKRIDNMNSKDFKTAEQRMTKQQEYREQARELIGDTSTWKDKKLGIQYQINTFKRNLRDIVKDAFGKADIQKADAIYEEYQGKYNQNEAKLKVESNKIKQPYVDLNLTKQEDAYVQMLGEFKYNPDTTITKKVVDDYYNEHKDKIDINKVDKAIESARKTYDSLHERLNEVLRNQGMKEIGYRQGYFPHFTEEKQSMLAKLFDWKVHNNQIPTDIAGLTELNNPERSWQSFNKQRKGDTTDYSFSKGLDTYVHGALDWIYHIEDIQKRRAFENEIRYQHSEKGVQEKIEAIYSDPNLDADEIQAQIEAVYGVAKNPLNNFVTDLRNSTNNLAGKKSTLDRSMEYATNRQIYSTMTNLSNRVSGNLVGGSISSALTNFIPITQSWAEVSPLSSLNASREVLKNTIKDDGTIAKSTFLTNRLIKEENLYKSNWDKARDVVGFMMDAIDSFTSQVVWRSKYNENLKNGMNEFDAIANADQFAENVMAGRSRGNQPTIFDSKNPITKMFTSFQLEVNNGYQYMFKDMPIDIGNKSKAKLIKGYATMFLGAYVYNALYSTLTGRDAAFDPIGIVEDILKELGIGGDDEDEKSASEKFTAITEDLVQDLPFVGGLFGGGRVPISAAIPYDNPIEMVSGTVTDALDAIAPIFDKDEDVKEKSKKALKDLTSEWLKPVTYLALPFGGGQISKSIKGLSMYDGDLPVAGSYTNSGDLRFPVEDTLGNRIQAGLFGQYASKNAGIYFDEERSPLKEKQIQEYADLDLPIREYWDYRDGLKGLNTLEEKFEYVNDLDVTDEQKNIMINNIVDRKEEVDMSNYDDYGSYEEFDFAIKNEEKYDFLQKNNISYSEYVASDESKEAYNWAFKNPDSYSISKAVTDDVVIYRQYKNDIYDIAADKDENGDSIRGSRKEKIISYVNGLDLSIPQKAILIRQEYTSFNDYNNQIVEYVASLNISYEEKVKIIEGLDMTIGSDGRVYWK